MNFCLRLREPFSSASHLFGALAGIVGAIYLLCDCDQHWSSVVTVLVYSLALISLFLVSGLLHGLHCSAATLEKLERLDYAAIYLFIAGTYTPICLFVISGPFGISLLVAEWFLAGLGAWLSLTRGPQSRNLQVCIYLAMGWAFLLLLPTLSHALSPLAFNLLILGGMLYSVGAVVFIINCPNLFRTRYSAHEFWHVMVLLAGSAHYFAIAQVIPSS